MRRTLSITEAILTEARKPLRVRELLDRSRGRYPTRARFPDTVIARDLALDVRDNPGSRFERVESGLYGLRELNDLGTK